MPARRSRQAYALSLAAALVGWSFAGPRLPARWWMALQAGLGGALVLVTRAPLGLGPPRLWAGLRLGSAVAFSAASTVAATTRLPPVRQSMAVREPPASAPDWLLVRIPVGTVWSEESAFRGALATASSAAFGRRGGRVLQATAFGLSHIPDARATGEPVAATVLVTGIGGWLFGWLADRTGSLAAPMLAHLAINEAGAIAVLAARSRGPVRG
ncbi:CPBP family intramembrane metalloprotease [Mycobacterium intracellulare]|uniref:CPBP family intramembrane glutamic endopeptidase n=1 Tax=Mycobacterium intracellulare TaxID=1767 RepID=A0AAE4RDT5_MYCIT|nr:CPBP family intramembrane glutamic endopeptidase [Mycobacterium intracellulare]MCA2320897.1 CPBP family intramembrane metalloprotease [Mycobacterium intracellulare]MCA2341368.1 CPBP family intramembrane metalloprotease [Mycobacterium intracellulare]MDV6977096.1 CPBP family intramembrane glutamic endopeptidase [Mycobacterium intracellulare]MDV6982393.1 CPBP family intramembrane glutamic endopeptidase [Mycobacterium intracellulare]MDV7012383.1 CPBP family intramembrane glutamic endopeptidase 